MAEEKLSDLLANLVAGKREQDTRLEALLEAIKNPPAPDAATVRADKVLKNTSNLGGRRPPNIILKLPF